MRKILTLAIVVRDGRVCLGHKKRGFGRGWYNGFGGKVRHGEDVLAAAKRELDEEAGVSATVWEPRGTLTFTFKGQPDELMVHLFTVSDLTGEPVETGEMRPEWFAVGEVPYHQMWPADRHWMPIVLAGSSVRASFHYDGAGQQLVRQQVEEVLELSGA